MDVPVVADAGTALEKLIEWAEPKKTVKWMEQIKVWDEENPLAMRRDRGISPQMIMEHINAQFPHSIYVTDVGQHQMWATQYLELDESSQLITSGGLGTMGFGFPAAIGAKIANRDKDVVLVTGDGGFQMNIQEMATAVTQGTPITICLLNNYYLGMVRQMQELFSGKSYNLQSLTVGTTEDETISRMTICVTSDDITFEQIKKQLNRMVEVIKVIDLTDVPLHMKEILYAKVMDVDSAQISEIFQIAQVFKVDVVDIGKDSVLLECMLTERRNNELIALLKNKYHRISVVRGGAVAIETISTGCR